MNQQGHKKCISQWQRLLSLILLLALSYQGSAFDSVAGPAFSNFRMTLESGRRTEAVGPFWYADETEDQRRWAVPPLLSYTRYTSIDAEEFDLGYPLLTYDRFGEEYRFQILQLFSFAGGRGPAETNRHRFSLFPFYLQQWSKDGEGDYLSILPFYGHVENRFFRDEVDYVLLPLWVKSRKRDVITRNYVWPVFHLREGNGLKGWQFWPVVGHEKKTVTLQTNHWGDEAINPGHVKRFVLWPLFMDLRSGIGGTNEGYTQASIPFYSFTRSALRDSTAIPFVLGWSSVEDRQKKYREYGAPWPLVVFRRGENTHVNRIWPLYSKATNASLESSWVMWPVYKYNRITSEPLDRERTRILFFLYSDTIERNTESGAAQRRRDCWPLFINRQDWDGNQRLQVLALLEPLLPGNKSVDRVYSPVWSLWRSEKNGKTGARSQSLLWNLYRRRTDRDGSETSAVFGLVQHRRNGTKGQWRLFWWPQSQDAAASPTPPKSE